MVLKVFVGAVTKGVGERIRDSPDDTTGRESEEISTHECVDRVSISHKSWCSTYMKTYNGVGYAGIPRLAFSFYPCISN